ncbi:MAG TPA: T9SS type A sorting domain-containing protein [Chitinophagales bacterium]|nr:T9SS type A sorting domain-containing protein [Chitinophagales bacterium]
MRKLYVLLFSVSIQAVVLAQSGTLDYSFGTNGRFIFNPDIINEQVQGMALTKFNKILVLININVLDWNDHQTFLIRFNNNGVIDSSFGDNGVKQVLVDEYSAFGSSIAVDDSNRIILVDHDGEYSGSTRVYRLKANGSEDSNFGSFGQVHLGMHNSDNGLLIQHDGKIIVGGSYSITRINNDGSLDASFNSASNLTFSSLPDAFVLGIGQQANDKILVTGNSDSSLFVVRLNSDGTADSTFGINGITHIDSSGNEVGQHAIEMPNGKVVVTGYTQTDSTSDLYCWRMNADGTADNSFGNDGSLLLFSGAGDNFGFFIFPSADSSVILIGSAFNGTSNDPVIFRLTNDGTIDTNFGVSGISGKTFTSCKSIELGSCQDDNGKILISGTATFNGNNELAVSRFTTTGDSDSTFGINGTISKNVLNSESVDKSVSAFAILPGGKFLGAGSAFDLTMFRLNSSGISDSSYAVNGILVPNSQRLLERQSKMASDSTSVYVAENFASPVFGFESFNYDFDNYPLTGFAVHKFKSDGTIDSSYGINGIIEPLMIGNSLTMVTDIALQQDGKLLLCGLAPDNLLNTEIYLMRLNTDGSFDETFGDQGILTFDWTQEDFYLSMDLEMDGKIVLQETLFPGYQTLLRTERLLSDGTPDASFGNNGQEDVILGQFDASLGTKVQPDKKILTMIVYSSNGNHYEILRLNESGEVDSTFGTNGYASLEDAGFLSRPIMLVQPDGKTLCLDVSYEAGYTLTIARLLYNGTFDATFGLGGISVFDTSASFGTSDMHLQDDGKIVVAGNSDQNNFYMARLLNDVGIPLHSVETSFPQVQVYPNPASSQLIIEFPSLSKETEIILRDVTGKILCKEKTNSMSGHFMIKVDDLPAGIYFLGLQAGNTYASAKFVKQ